MASLKNAMKSQREHRERHQSMARSHLGPLEKKKDYRVRAKDQQAKKKAIATLHKKALSKNPDEFHFHMINSELKDGVHFEKVGEEELAVRDVVQDLLYVTHRRSLEKKKIEKLKAQLHLLDTGTEEQQQQNTHILFVDTEKEARRADPAKLLDTHPALLGRRVNRLRTSQLASLATQLPDPAAVKEMSRGRKKAYKELAQRIEREEKLRIMQEKLEVRKKLMNAKGKKNKKNGSSEKPELVAEGSSTSAPVYRWPQIRKR